MSDDFAPCYTLEEHFRGALGDVPGVVFTEHPPIERSSHHTSLRAQLDLPDGSCLYRVEDVDMRQEEIAFYNNLVAMAKSLGVQMRAHVRKYMQNELAM